jgi:hypothetical protein
VKAGKPAATGQQTKAAGNSKGRRKPSRTAAVTITCPPGEYAAIMGEARKNVSLSELGIPGVKVKRAITGALIMEVPGPKGPEKADKLAEKLANLFAARKGVKVARPSKRGELRVRDLDDSVTAEDIAKAVAESGGYSLTEVKVGEVKMSPVGLGTAWVQCPLVAANKLDKVGRIQVGWVKARIGALEQRPLQCFKCLERGHLRSRCPNKEDRSKACYR